MPFSNCTFLFWEQFYWINFFPFFRTVLYSWKDSSKPDWSRKTDWFKQFFLLINLASRVHSFYIQTKFRLRNRVTTEHLLQCKINIFIHLFYGKNLRQIKENLPREVSINIKKSFFDSFTVVYIHLNLSTLV